eukprot:m.896656 g.896656  ORF g.896656 m.896656 type:complete len:50 (-) comp23667_c0_seq4:109-258(-)
MKKMPTAVSLDQEAWNSRGTTTNAAIGYTHACAVYNTAGSTSNQRNAYY